MLSAVCNSADYNCLDSGTTSNLLYTIWDTTATLMFVTTPKGSMKLNACILLLAHTVYLLPKHNLLLAYIHSKVHTHDPLCDPFLLSVPPFSLPRSICTPIFTLLLMYLEIPFLCCGATLVHSWPWMVLNWTLSPSPPPLSPLNGPLRVHVTYHLKTTLQYRLCTVWYN